MRLDSRVILAVDADPPGDVLQTLLPGVDGVKLGLPLLLRRGPDHLRDLADRVEAAGDGLGVVVDLKLADIPAVTEASVEACMELGATHVICHGFPGEDSVRAACEAAGGRVFVVCEMSHPGGARFLAPHAEEIVQIAAKSGATGIVAPATRPERIEVLRRAADRAAEEDTPGLRIAAPGVGTQGGDAADAVRAGADWLIIGRSILTAEDPARAAAGFAEAAQAAAGLREGG